MQRVFTCALNEDYLTVLTTLISYLRRQQKSLYSVIGDFFMILRLFKNVVFK